MPKTGTSETKHYEVPFVAPASQQFKTTFEKTSRTLGASYTSVAAEVLEKLRHFVVTSSVLVQSFAPHIWVFPKSWGYP